MTSRAREQNSFLNPAPATEPAENKSVKVKRHATVYDAVAGGTSISKVNESSAYHYLGRVSAAGFIPAVPLIPSARDTASSTSKAVSPEAVLFRRKKAPTRYEESDFYFASDSLPENALPDSDLVKALHCYTSDFYSRATANGGTTDWRSMDETALLGLGILMEEICRESLGERGDLVFTEGQLNEGPEQSFGPIGETNVIEASEAAAKSGRTRKGKRRRLDVEYSDQSMN